MRNSPERTKKKFDNAIEDLKNLSDELRSEKRVSIEIALHRLAEAVIILLEKNNE